MKRRTILAASAAFAAVGSLSRPSLAQAFPSRPIRLVIPYPAGGTTDVIARSLQGPMQDTFNQPVVIDNRGGGAGAIGMNEVARAPADGHTMVISNNGPTSVLPSLQPGVGYDGLQSFTPISRLSYSPLLVVVHPSVPAEDVAGLIRHAKANPGRLSYASAGVGSLGHMASARFCQAAGIQVEHIPYRGQAATTQAMLTGETQLLISTSSTAMAQLVSDGKLRLLAVTTKEPATLFPDLPTVAATLPGFDVAVWFGLLGPAGIPPTTVGALNRVVNAALAAPDVQARFRGFGQIAGGTTPEAMRAIIATEIPIWAATIREGRITL